MKRLACLIFAWLPVSAIAQSNLVYLEFEGGSTTYTPLTINLLTPIQFEVLETASISGIFFIFDGVGNLVNERDPREVTGNLDATLNGVPYSAILVQSGYTSNNVSADDVYIVYNVLQGYRAQEGDVIALGTGAITTNGGIYSLTPPVDGFYPLFIVDSYGNEIVASAVIPEPSMCGLALGVGILATVISRRRRKVRCV